MFPFWKKTYVCSKDLRTISWRFQCTDLSKVLIPISSIRKYKKSRTQPPLSLYTYNLHRFLNERIRAPDTNITEPDHLAARHRKSIQLSQSGSYRRNRGRQIVGDVDNLQTATRWAPRTLVRLYPIGQTRSDWLPYLCRSSARFG